MGTVSGCHGRGRLITAEKKRARGVLSSGRRIAIRWKRLEGRWAVTRDACDKAAVVCVSFIEREDRVEVFYCFIWWKHGRRFRFAKRMQ